jgi:signal transduction histidine kinase
VEEGQLSLAPEEISFATLYEGAMLKANDLCGDYRPQVFEEFDPHIPPLLIDRSHTERAFATLLAYSVRTHRGGKMWVRAERESPNRLRIDIDVPSPEHSPRALEGMLSTHTEVERREHRGLSLGLRLAQAIVKLHGGSVRVLDRGKKGAMFCFTLPTLSVPLPIASSPAHSVPPPPSGRAMPASSFPPPMSAGPGFNDEEPPAPDIPSAPRLPQTSRRRGDGPQEE